ncbi:DUF6600 domain-containing protein [Cupriavidus sp. H18C2]|uniref:DUF6600 domain-containing protein n=1 Tax=Cupriavidus sp. H18C2 TaxID=3241602 RepID=UPI003BF8D249
MQPRYRLVIVPAVGLAALLAQGQAGAQDYNAAVPPGYVERAPDDANVLGDPSALAADPPSRIATVTDMAGGLSFAPAGSDEWAPVGLNRPMTTGDRLWVDPGGRAELHAGTTAVRLGGGTAATILNLDERATQVKLTQGTLQLRVRALPPDQQVEVDTPNLAFVPREPGDYRIDVSPDGTTTLVTMRHGSAVLYGDTRAIELTRGQRMRFAGTDLADAGPGNYPGPDSFDQWTAARDAREDASPSARYVPADMTGYTALDDYGDWQQDPGYGAVWFPRTVAAGWAPYSAGHWAWVAPWGWTWIDDAPWGFAPSHYGRWAYFGNRWGWVPGPVAVRPCYAPAVVGFIGGTSIRIGGGPGVAWYPLGPRDVYRPVYRASPRYITRINNITVNNTWMRGGDRDRWVNRNVPGAITGMPSRNFVEGRPVPRGSHRDEWRTLPVGEGRGGPIIAPVKASLWGGGARPQGLPPMARQGFERQAIAARQPGRLGSDDLARRFAREGGTAGAGPAWRGPQPGQEGRGQQAGRDDRRRGPQPAQALPWQPDVRMSQAAQAGRGPGGWSGGPPRAGMPDAQRQQFVQQRQLDDQQRQSADNQRQQQQALQRQLDSQQRQMQGQRWQGEDQQRRQQFEQQRMMQDQQRQLDDQRREAMNRQQFDQQRQQQERQQQDIQRQAQERQRQFDQQRQQQDRQQQDVQRQAQERQRQFDQQRQQQDRQQQDVQRQAQERQRQFADQQRQAQERQADMQRQAQMRDQQRQFQEQQRQQIDQQRQQAAQRQQLEQARQFQEQQRQQFEQQRQQAMQRQQIMEQQRQAQEQQRRVHEQQQQQAQQQQQHMQRQAQEQQRQFQEQQRQQQDRQRQFQQQQQQRGQQARNDDRR